MILIYAVLTFFVAIKCDNAAHSSNYDVINFGRGSRNNLIDQSDDIIIPKPKPLKDTRIYDGKNSKGENCTCGPSNRPTIDYLPPTDCDCCCKTRIRDYLPPDNCKVCKKCICDRKTFTLINSEAGNCPTDCQPRCTCDYRTYTLINPDAGNCPKNCRPRCTCDYRTYTLVNVTEGNCPTDCHPRCTCDHSTNPPRLVNEQYKPCPECRVRCSCDYKTYTLINPEATPCPRCERPKPPPCRCIKGEYVNESSGNCKPKSEICTCYCDKDGRHVYAENGPCPKCPYHYSKPAGYDKLPNGLRD